MDIHLPPKRKPTESIVPMINVVFLLLIFFLMTSRLAQPDPFEISPPTAALEGQAESQQMLFVDKDGRLSFEGKEGDAAWAALGDAGQAGSEAVPVILQMRADGNIKAQVLAGILKRLSETGFGGVELVVRP